jgi:hypothetical protein
MTTPTSIPSFYIVNPRHDRQCAVFVVLDRLLEDDDLLRSVREHLESQARSLEEEARQKRLLGATLARMSLRLRSPR